MRIVLGAAAALFVFWVSNAHATPPPDQVGDAYEMALHSEHETRGDASSGSSSSSFTLIERVLAVREDGVELEYDLPYGASEQARGTYWQYPARVFKPNGGGDLLLLNAPELEARVDIWLAAMQIPKEACGRWIFTWTSIKIECDPRSVLSSLEAFDLRPAATDATVEPINPEAARRERAQADVAVAQMMGQSPLALEDAIAARSEERYTGTVTSRYETDEDGRITRRVVMSEVEIIEADGARERITRTTTIERRRIAPHE